MDSKGPGQQTETISMASMPLVPQTALSAVLHNSGPGLFTMGTAATNTSAPPAKKSLNFENATAPPEQVIVHDTAVQTVPNNQNNSDSGATAGGSAGTSLQTQKVTRHPNAIK